MEAVDKIWRDWNHNSTKNIEFEVVVFFSSVNLKKTMGLTPSNRLFACVVRVLCPIWISFKIGSIRSVPSLTWKISSSRIFPKNLIVLTEREKFNASSNIMTGVFQDILFFFFWPNFFFTFFKLEIFCIFVFLDLPSGFLWLWYWFLANLVCI